MPAFAAPASSRVTMKVRVDKRPYLAGFQTPPLNSNWENITPDTDGMGESREFMMPGKQGDIVRFTGEYDEKIGSNDPDPKATYTITFSSGGADRVVVPKDMGPVAREYTFTAT